MKNNKKVKDNIYLPFFAGRGGGGVAKMRNSTVMDVEKEISLKLCSPVPCRLSTTRLTPLQAMSGALGLSCMRSGVWDTNPLKHWPITRYN